MPAFHVISIHNRFFIGSRFNVRHLVPVELESSVRPGSVIFIEYGDEGRAVVDGTDTSDTCPAWTAALERRDRRLAEWCAARGLVLGLGAVC